jgi:hypothetical protein
MESEAQRAKRRKRQERYEKSPAGRASRRLANMRHRLRNLETFRAKARAKRQLLREEIRALKSRPCMDCGGTFDPVCMDFDHRPGETKIQAVSKITATSKSAVYRDREMRCSVLELSPATNEE